MGIGQIQITIDLISMILGAVLVILAIIIKDYAKLKSNEKKKKPILDEVE